MKFLIDECLSPSLATLARKRGFDASSHVTWLGMRSRSDRAVVGRALLDGFVLVTNNSVDFRTLLNREEIHAGLVCLNVAPEHMRLAVQEVLFSLALDRLGGSEPLNEVLEISLQFDGSVIVERYALPSPGIAVPRHGK